MLKCSFISSIKKTITALHKLTFSMRGTSLQKCISAKLQRYKKGCEILAKRASQTKTSDKYGKFIYPFLSWIGFLFFDRHASFEDLRSSVKLSYLV